MESSELICKNCGAVMAVAEGGAPSRCCSAQNLIPTSSPLGREMLRSQAVARAREAAFTRKPESTTPSTVGPAPVPGQAPASERSGRAARRGWSSAFMDFRDFLGSLNLRKLLLLAGGCLLAVASYAAYSALVRRAEAKATLAHIGARERMLAAVAAEVEERRFSSERLAAETRMARLARELELRGNADSQVDERFARSEELREKEDESTAEQALRQAEFTEEKRREERARWAARSGRPSSFTLERDAKEHARQARTLQANRVAALRREAQEKQRREHALDYLVVECERSKVWNRTRLNEVIVVARSAGGQGCTELKQNADAIGSTIGNFPVSTRKQAARLAELLAWLGSHCAPPAPPSEWEGAVQECGRLGSALQDFQTFCSSRTGS